MIQFYVLSILIIDYYLHMHISQSNILPCCNHFQDMMYPYVIYYQVSVVLSEATLSNQRRLGTSAGLVSFIAFIFTVISQLCYTRGKAVCGGAYQSREKRCWVKQSSCFKVSCYHQFNSQKRVLLLKRKYLILLPPLNKKPNLQQHCRCVCLISF